VKTFACGAALIMVTLALSPALYAQDEEIPPPSPPDQSNNIFFTFNQGASAAWLTRVINQNERSNFVFRDFLPGLYFGAELRSLPYIIPMARLAAYYPLTTTFNDMPQKPVTPLHFAADMVIGLRFEPFTIKYVRINAGPGLHLFFLNADRWNYFNVGAAAAAGVELPLVTRWTLLVDGYASIDNGNWGSNRQMEPFDIAWQYQINVGFRYSRKKENSSPLFGKQREESFSDEYLLR